MLAEDDTCDMRTMLRREAVSCDIGYQSVKSSEFCVDEARMAKVDGAI
jgi:hypothetical protein